MKKEIKVVPPEEERKQVSEIIFKVLSERLCVREAIKLFPKESSDPSVKAVWHALVHFEADESLRRTDIEYAREQDDYLELAGLIMKDGNPLPLNIINSYNKYYEEAMLPRNTGFLSTLKSLFRFTI